MPAPVASAVSPSSAIGNLLAGGQSQGGADEVRAQLEALVRQISDIGTMVDAVAMEMPNLADSAARVKAELKQMVVQAAQQSPEGTGSGNAVPTGGSMGPNPQ